MAGENSELLGIRTGLKTIPLRDEKRDDKRDEKKVEKKE